jgi:hypothetical protein
VPILEPPAQETSARNSALAAVASHQVWDFSDLVLKQRFARAIEAGASRYAIHRRLRFAARTDLQLLFDRLALEPGWRAQRIESSSLILDSDGAYVVGHGGRKANYCSCYFNIWAGTVAAADRVRDAILAQVAGTRIVEPMFSIDWHFLTSKGELESASIEEMADDVLLDEAYPDLAAGVPDFIARFLAADETVLVLQGPPGTGKTRLIRAILGEMSRRKGGEAQALYTGDKKTLESDEIFVRFITGWEDAFVVEDADHLLKPRADGNEHLHRFLAIADGVVRAQGRKIVFSTNLPNVRDLDEALVRPGRCFARLLLRGLDRAEAVRLPQRLLAGDAGAAARAQQALGGAAPAVYSLAEIYRAATQARAPAEIRPAAPPA